MAADADAIAIGDAHRHDLVDRRLRARDELLDVGVVRRLARSDDRHRRVVEDRVAREQQEHVRHAAQHRERIRRAGDLARGVGVAELARVGPHDERHDGALLVARRQVQRPRQRDAVLALIGHVLAQDLARLRLWILERRRRLLRVGPDGAHEVVRRFLLRLVLSTRLSRCSASRVFQGIGMRGMAAPLPGFAG